LISSVSWQVPDFASSKARSIAVFRNSAKVRSLKRGRNDPHNGSLDGEYHDYLGSSAEIGRCRENDNLIRRS
jgi:hypothetical protein